MHWIKIYDQTKTKQSNYVFSPIKDQLTGDNGESKKKKTVKIANIIHKIAMSKPGELYIVT